MALDCALEHKSGTLLCLVLGLKDQMLGLGLVTQVGLLVLVLVLATQNLNLCLALNLWPLPLPSRLWRLKWQCNAAFTLIPVHHLYTHYYWRKIMERTDHGALK